MNYLVDSLDEAKSCIRLGEFAPEVVLLPPDVNELTDEDEIGENFCGELEVVDVPGLLECRDVDYYWQKSLPSEKQNDTSHKYVWKNVQPNYIFEYNADTKKENFDSVIKHVKGKSPMQYFEEFFTPGVYDMIVGETVRYACEKSNSGYTITIADIKKFFGFLLLSGVKSLPSDDLYWSESEDMGCAFTKRVLPFNVYQEVKSFLHFVDNTEAKNNKSDKLFKMRPLINMLNNNFQKWGVFHENTSVGEMIVPHTGIHSTRITCGYKLRLMCGKGYCYKFSFYCGEEQNTNSEISNMKWGPAVTSEMLSFVKDPSSHMVYLDSEFADMDLLISLKERGFRVTARLLDCEISREISVMKKDLRKSLEETYDYAFNEEKGILICKSSKWKSFSVATNFDSINPLATVQKISRTDKQCTLFQEPCLVKHFNENCNIIGIYNVLLEECCCRITGKKWYWGLITKIIDIAVVNAFYLYDEIEDTGIDLVKFRSILFRSYMETIHNSGSFSSIGIPVSTFKKKNVPSYIKFDGKNHFFEKRDRQKRCQSKHCHKKTFNACAKCNVALCTACFPLFHTVKS